VRVRRVSVRVEKGERKCEIVQCGRWLDCEYVVLV